MPPCRTARRRGHPRPCAARPSRSPSGNAGCERLAEGRFGTCRPTAPAQRRRWRRPAATCATAEQASVGHGLLLVSEKMRRSSSDNDLVRGRARRGRRRSTRAAPGRHRRPNAVLGRGVPHPPRADADGHRDAGRSTRQSTERPPVRPFAARLGIPGGHVRLRAAGAQRRLRRAHDDRRAVARARGDSLPPRGGSHGVLAASPPTRSSSGKMPRCMPSQR